MSGRVLVLVLAFLAGAAVMTAELTAPRLVAPHLGTSVLTWTTVIATFLGGIAIGNAIGGRLADAGKRSTLAWLFAFGGGCVALAIPFDGFLREALSGLDHGWRTPLSVLLTFLPAAVALGAAPPVLGRAVLATGGSPGRALGELAAAGAIGSVAGTFVTGFVLVPSFGTRAIHFVLAGTLAALALPALCVSAGARAAAPAAPDAPTHVFARWWALALLAGGALLVVEIVAGRAAAIHLGSSVYTWTSVIGVVLVGLSIGNVVGGRLADRHEARPLLGALFLIASATTATCLWTPALMDQVADGPGPWPLRVLLATAVGFLVPAAALGALSPVVVKAALSDPATDGRVVGRIYAFGTVGAVLGAMLTPYILIPLLAIPLLVIAVAIVLALASGRLRRHQEIPWLVTLVALALLARLPMDVPRTLGNALGLREDAEAIHVTDSRYFHIVVAPYAERWVRVEAEVDAAGIASDATLAGRATWDPRKRRLTWIGPMAQAELRALDGFVTTVPGGPNPVAELHSRTGNDVRYMSLDRLVHGFVDMDTPGWLEYDYERITDAIVERDWQAGDIRAYFIGGGTYTYQRQLLEQHAGHVRVITSEIDPAVTAAARSALGLERYADQTIAHEDARTHLAQMDDATFDYVFGDAFHDVGVPWHLTTQECARLVRQKLKPGGIYLVNVVDVFAAGRFLGAMVATLETAFPEVRVLSMGPRDDHRQETFVIVATDAPPELDGLTDDDGLLLPTVQYGDADLRAIRNRAGNLVLTDDYAPVEALLAPVVERRGAKGER